MGDESKKPKTPLDVAAKAISDIGRRIDIECNEEESDSISKMAQALKSACEGYAALVEAAKHPGG